MYHLHVEVTAEVCLDILNDKWKSSMSIRTVLMALRSMMFCCNPDEALVPSIAKQYRENREEFDKMARIWTQRYAV
ncbi:ubiquitin--protein ligase [Ancylostoma caninum]|uniref:Ubiquitin--protein ligase n=1 Tax=Ancylostoma caninum TaxID=29170 RepID=A0A368FLA3_ANCCA|nr:ubiquitin--protein ligase [Ancylostoma caninum]